MNLHVISTGVSLVGLLISMMLGSMWLGELSTDVNHLKTSSVNGERIARIEGRLDALADSQSRLSASLDRFLTQYERDRLSRR